MFKYKMLLDEIKSQTTYSYLHKYGQLLGFLIMLQFQSLWY